MNLIEMKCTQAYLFCHQVTSVLWNRASPVYRFPCTVKTKSASQQLVSKSASQQLFSKSASRQPFSKGEQCVDDKEEHTRQRQEVPTHQRSEHSRMCERHIYICIKHVNIASCNPPLRGRFSWQREEIIVKGPPMKNMRRLEETIFEFKVTFAERSSMGRKTDSFIYIYQNEVPREG